MSDEAVTYPRRIRSFVLRAGRMTRGQQRAMDEYWPRWGLELEQGMLDAQAAFGRQAPLVLEIGFGMGQSLSEMAAAAPERNFIGIEVHRPGVGRLLHDLGEQGSVNVRVYCEDAVLVLQQCIADASLEGVQIFFPDPWHKKRHHKRRLIQCEFVSLLASKLKPGGRLHLATDWENYAEHMLAVMAGVPQFNNEAGPGQYSPRPDYRPLTKFEKRGQRLGHGVWDLIFTRK
jgi:tRNA (guanine-N7-)-methyltransferase